MQPLLGNINQDINPNQRKKEDPTFVLNGIRESISGGKGTYQSEPGNELLHVLSYTEIGRIYGEDGSIYIFSTNNNVSEIGRLRNDTYTTLVVTDLGFNTKYPVTGIYRVVRGCERILYFCDGNSEDKFFNVDKPEQFQNSLGDWDPNLFKLRPDITPPKLDIDAVSNTGGNLLSGMYFFQVEILDTNLNTIYRTPISQGVSIYNDQLSANYQDITGNFNYPAVSPLAGGKPITNKSISIRISELDTRFTYIRLNVIRSITGDGSTVEGYTKGDLIPISNKEINYLFTDLANLDQLEDVSKFIVPLAQWNSSESMEQVDNSLVRFNVKEIKRDYSKYQRCSSKIVTNYVINEVAALDPTVLGNPKNPRTPYYMMSALGDEVVALGIVYVHKDGSESPQFHIPGICKDKSGIAAAEVRCLRLVVEQTTPNPGETTNVTINYEIDGEPFSFSVFDTQGGNFLLVCVDSSSTFNVIDILNSNPGNFDADPVETIELQSIGSSAPIVGSNWHSGTIDKALDLNAAHLNKFELNPDGSIKLDINGNPIPRTIYERWEVYNTAVKIGSNKGWMGYHENSSVLYPNIKDCDNLDIWGKDACGNDLVGTPLRHHRLPDRQLEPHYLNNGSLVTVTKYCINVTLESDIVPPSFIPVTIEVDYNIGVNNFIETFTYFELDVEQCVKVLEQLPVINSVTVTLSDPINGTVTVKNSNVSTITTQTDNSTLEVIRLIGFEFSNIEYPSPDIVGHYFVIADTEQTIIAKGYNARLPRMASPTFDGYVEDVSGFPLPPPGMTLSDRYQFMSPEFLYDQNFINGEYFKAEKIASSLTTNYDSFHLDQGTVFSGQPDLGFIGKNTSIKALSNHTIQNAPISDFAAIDPLSTYDNPTTNERISNYSLNNRIFTMKSSINVTGNNRATYGSVKVEREVYRDLFSIRYRRMHSNLLRLNDPNRVYGGSYYISRMDYVNNMFIRYQGNKLTPALFGAIFFLVKLYNAIQFQESIIRMFTEYLTKDFGTNTNYLLLTAQSLNRFFCYAGYSVSDMYVESRINVSLANESSDIERTIFRNERVSAFVFRQTTVKQRTEKEGDIYYVRPDSSLYFYSYNKDFSRINNFFPYFSLPLTYDYCSRCQNEYPNKLIFSPISLEEDRYDSYRIVLATDNRDVPSHRGKGVFLKLIKDKLILHCEQSTFVTNPNPRTMQTTQETVYIGTGNFLSIPPVELFDSDTGRAGLQSKLSPINCEGNYIWPDESRGQVFMIGQESGELSRIGLTQWFLNNLPNTLINQLESEYGIIIPNASTYKVGCNATYDPRFKRYILTKLDYKIIPSNLPYLPDNPLEDTLYIDAEGNIYRTSRTFVYDELYDPTDNDPLIVNLGGSFDNPVVKINGVITNDYTVDEGIITFTVSIEPGSRIQIALTNEINVDLVPYTDSEVYENKSFTISYSLEFKGWSSWHSYKPSIMMFDETYFYSVIGNLIHKHLHVGNYQTYYGSKYPFIVEYYDTKYMTKDLDAIHYLGYSEEWDSNNKQWIDRSNTVTFNGILLYNSDCISGYINLNLLDSENDFYSNIAYNPLQRSVIRTDNNYKISKLYDLSTGSPVVTSQWSKIAGQYNANGYIDLIANPDVIDPNKSQYNLGRIKGKYIAVRLFFNPDSDVKKIIYLINASESDSIR